MLHLPRNPSSRNKANLHWVHWCLLFASFILTLTAWYIAKTVVKEKLVAAFDKEASQVTELITERMSKYEDALWAGVAATYNHGGEVDEDSWRIFTETLNIDTKYPGVNGVGMILYVPPESLSSFLKKQKMSRPDFHIHPTHSRTGYWPITFVEPVALNAEAIGLDLAHESNRYAAAIMARNTGKARITGPIVLVQDKEQTAGFLFFAPFYQTLESSYSEARDKSFVGLVYAPFIMKKLMGGTLEKGKRHVGVKISDEGQVIYDEHVAAEAAYDPEPLFSRTENIAMYGRTWQFDLNSTLDFKTNNTNHQPLLVLVGGLIINLLLLGLFTTLVRTHRQTSYALEDTQKKHQLYMDASGDGYWDWFIQKNHKLMSSAFWGMFGYLPEEKPNKPNAWEDILVPEDKELLQASLNAYWSAKEQTPFELEVRAQHKNGSEITVLYKGKVIDRDANDKPVRMVGTTTNITALKSTESKLREASERYDLAVQGSGAGLWDWNIKNDTLYWSDQFKALIGVNGLDITPNFQEFSDRLHPDDKQRILDALTAHLDRLKGFEEEYRLRHNSGHYVWVLGRGQAIWDNKGKATRMAGSIIDITGQKSNALALERALDFQKLLTNVNTDLVFVKDKQYRFVEANPAFINLYPKEQQSKVIGYTTNEEYDAEQVEEFLAADREAFEKGSSEVVETIDFPDGIQRTLLTKKIRFNSHSGEEFIIGIARDISELKKTEHELRKANTELEEFTYRTSHDLRSPLISSIKLLDFIRTQTESGDTAKSLKHIALVQQSLKKLDRLVHDILSLTKLSHTDSPVCAVSIANEVKSCLEKIEHIEGYERIKFSFDYQYNGKIFTQKEQIILILDNLLSNAVKYQDPNEANPQVKISTRQEGKTIIFTVSDNGLGIPEVSQGSVFEMFRRFHPNTAFGSGLGLYMIKKSVLKMHGDITYTSLTKGSQFTVKLPTGS